jgi:DNA-binding transcriptional ArsR family regulator
VDPFEVISDPTRRKLIELLATGERPVGDLVQHFDISFSAISQQLRILSEAQFVHARREGRHQIYRLDPSSLDPVAGWLTLHARNFWKKKLQNLDTVLRRMKTDET